MVFVSPSKALVAGLFWYMEDMEALHTSVPVEPQLLSNLMTLAVYVPAAQFKQVDADEAARAVEYRPAEQLRHTAAVVAPKTEE